VTSPSLDRVYDGTNTSALITPAVGGKVSAPLYDGGRSGLQFASPWGGFTAPVGTYYMSFLATFGSASAADGVGGHRVIEMYDGTLTDDNYRTLQLGYSLWSGLGDGQHLTFGVNGDNIQLSENVNFVQDQGTVHHLVLKFEMKETDFDPLTTEDNDVVSVYLDPVGSSEPGVPSAQVSTEDFLASYLTTVSKFAWVGGTEVGFDELRVATTFAEVANNLQPYVAQRLVPEPTSFVLLGMAFLGLLGIRKK
jgi:hypothetical protein